MKTSPMLLRQCAGCPRTLYFYAELPVPDLCHRCEHFKAETHSTMATFFVFALLFTLMALGCATLRGRETVQSAQRKSLLPHWDCPERGEKTCKEEK